MTASKIYVTSALGMLLLGACHLAVGLDDLALQDPIGVGGGAADGGAEASGGTGGVGGMGGEGGGGCTSAEECPPPDSVCQVASCDFDTGECSFTDLPDGPQEVQTPGDCQVTSCQGGELINTEDDTDFPEDNNPCTDDLCQDGVPENAPRTGQPCGGANGTCNEQGQCVGCVTNVDCGIDTFCLQWSCSAQQICEQQFPNAGQPLPTGQTPSDCKVVVCGDNGVETVVNDPSDVVVDGLECTSDSCLGGTPSNPPESPGKPCSAGVCDGAGACVECVNDSQCTTPQRCDPPANLCKSGKAAACNVDDDCFSGHCVDDVCCSDACTATCFACDLPGAVGDCAPVPLQTDPDNECPGGFCDGLGACKSP